MILELNMDEMLVYNVLTESGLSDFAILAPLFDTFGLTTKMIKRADIVEAIRECVAS